MCLYFRMLEYIYIFNIYIEMCLEIDSFDLLIQPKLFFSLPTDYYSVLQSLLLVFVREVITYTVVQDFKLFRAVAICGLKKI